MNADEKKCPDCAEIIKKDAVVCKHCGHRFSQQEMEAEKRRAAEMQKNGAMGCIVLVVLIAIIGTCSSGNERSNTSAVVAPFEDPAVSNLSPEQQKALEERNKDEIAAILTRVRKLPAADIEGNERAYAELVRLAPGNATYSEKLSHYRGLKALAATYEENPERALEITKFSWEKGGFGSVQLVHFTVKNNAPFPIRDFELTCTHQGPSGTDMDKNVRTVYELVPANGSKRVGEVNMGLIHSQAASSRCEITDAIRI